MLEGRQGFQLKVLGRLLRAIVFEVVFPTGKTDETVCQNVFFSSIIPKVGCEILQIDTFGSKEVYWY